MNHKVVFLCGSHMRHLYIAEKLMLKGRLAALVIEDREAFIPQPPEGLSKRDTENFILHFARRADAEEKYFGQVDTDAVLNGVPVLHVTQDTLNSEETVLFLKRQQAELLLTYGVHKVSGEIIDCFENRSFNIHGGLSPWYKGNTTMFWPFYFLKPNWAGMTIHRLTERMDGGEILHHSIPKLEYGDKMHEVSCKAVVQVAADLCEILDLLDAGRALKCTSQKSNGKLFLSSDWCPQTLRVIYELFQDRIVDMYLNGELERSEPKLVNFLQKEIEGTAD